MNIPPLPWMSWQPGDRAVVRYRAPDGVHDALGEVLEVDVHYVLIRAKRGDVRVEASQMMTGKLVEKRSF